MAGLESLEELTPEQLGKLCRDALNWLAVISLAGNREAQKQIDLLLAEQSDLQDDSVPTNQVKAGGAIQRHQS